MDSQRPEVGCYYRCNDGEEVEVRAVSSAHVVCCQERIYSRDEFERFFTKFADAMSEDEASARNEEGYARFS